MKKTKYELDDYEACIYCGHIGILHEHKYGKCGGVCGHVENMSYCGCKVKRDLSL